MQYSELPLSFYNTNPDTAEALICLLGDADCLLVSVSVSIPEIVFKECPNLKYVGVFARALSRVDINAAKQNNVIVTNIVNWCDWETAEFVIASILYVFRALGNKHWIEAPQSLKGKQLGIIGLGEVGIQVAEFAKTFGMKIAYHNRRERSGAKELGLEYMNLKTLMRTSDIISLHVPPDSKIVEKEEFSVTSDKAVLVNTSVGEVMDTKAFANWISKRSHFAVFDRIAGDEIQPLKDLSNIYIADVNAYLTLGVKERRIRRLLDNVKYYIK